MSEQIEKLLNELAEYYAQVDALQLKKQTIIDGIYTPEIHNRIEAVEIEFGEKQKAAKENIEDLERRIKLETLSQPVHKTVKGAHLMAVYVKGRVTWESDKLEGLMLAFPALAGARKEGAPSVTIRRLG